jgi:hypothetical protein
MGFDVEFWIPATNKCLQSFWFSGKNVTLRWTFYHPWLENPYSPTTWVYSSVHQRGFLVIYLRVWATATVPSSLCLQELLRWVLASRRRTLRGSHAATRSAPCSAVPGRTGARVTWDIPLLRWFLTHCHMKKFPVSIPKWDLWHFGRVMIHQLFWS